MSAVQWLLEHEDDPTIDDPVPVPKVETAPKERPEKTDSVEVVSLLLSSRMLMYFISHSILLILYAT